MFRVYENHRIFVACAAVLIFLGIVGWNSRSYLTVTNRPFLNFGGYTGNIMDFNLQVENASFNLYELRTRFFTIGFEDLFAYPFKVLVATGSNVGFEENSTLNDFGAQWFWYSKNTIPERGQAPWRWRMLREGDFPFDTYRIVYFLGFNRTMGFTEMNVSSSIILPDAIKADWIIDQHLTPIPFPDNATFSDWGIDIADLRWLNAIHNRGEYVDFYRFDVILSRDPNQAKMYGLYLYLISSAIIFLVVFAGAWARKLDLQKALSLYLGIAFSIVAYSFTLIQLSPPIVATVHVFMAFAFVSCVGFVCLNLCKNAGGMMSSD